LADSSFEVGFAGPSLDNPVLFGRYADSLAEQLRRRYTSSAGYKISVEKKEKDPKKRKWSVNLLAGWFSGAEITIKPIEATPHRAVVGIAWNSRVLELLIGGVAVTGLLICLPLLVASVFVLHRMGFAVIVTIIVFFVWALIGSIVATGVARLFAALFGNEFDAQRRSTLLNEIKAVPLPSPPSPKT
jgi:hypothetical protein